MFTCPLRRLTVNRLILHISCPEPHLSVSPHLPTPCPSTTTNNTTMGLLSTTSITTTLLLSPIIRVQDGGDSSKAKATTAAAAALTPSGGATSVAKFTRTTRGEKKIPHSPSSRLWTPWLTTLCRGNEVVLQCSYDKWCCNSNSTYSIVIGPVPDGSARTSADASPGTSNDCCASDANLPDGTDYSVFPVNLTTHPQHQRPNSPPLPTKRTTKHGSPQAPRSTPTRPTLPHHKHKTTPSPSEPSSASPSASLSSSSSPPSSSSASGTDARVAPPPFSPPHRLAPLEAKFSDTSFPGSNVPEMHGTPVAHSCELPATEVSPP